MALSNSSNLIAEVSSVCAQIVPEGDGSVQRVNAKIEWCDTFANHFVTKCTLKQRVKVNSPVCSVSKEKGTRIFIDKKIN